MLINTWMFFRKWLSFSGKPSTKPPAKRRQGRRQAGFMRQSVYIGLGAEALESRQLLSATLLAPAAQTPPPTLAGGQVASSSAPAVTSGSPTINSAPTDPTPISTSLIATPQTPAADGANQVGFNGVAGAAGDQTSPAAPAVTTAVTPIVPAPTDPTDTLSTDTAPIDPAQMQAAFVNLFSLSGEIGTGGDQASTTEPAVTPGVTPNASSTTDLIPSGFAVNSPPTVSTPATGSLNENSSLSFSTANGNAISITDAAAGSNGESLTLSVSQGTLTLPSTTGLSFTAGANGSASFTVSGPLPNLDSALDGLVYQPTTLYSGTDSLTLSVSNPADSLSASTSVPITVAAVSAPTISAPASGSLSENGSLTFSSANGNAISITDSAAGTNAESLTLSASQGTVTLASTAGLSFTAGANGSSSFTVSGTVSNLDSALDGLVYQPTTLYSGADSLTASVSDPTDSLAASTSVSITVAALAAPTVSAPGSGSLSENGSLTLSSENSNAISITDDAAGSNAESLTLSASQGTLTLVSSNGLTFTNGTNGSSSFTVSGTVTDLNAALDGLAYQPTALYSGSDSLSVSVTNPGDKLSASTNVALTVAPLSAATINAPESPAATNTPNSTPAPSAPASAPVITASDSPSVTGTGSQTNSDGSSLALTDSATGTDPDSLSQSDSQGTTSLVSPTGMSFATATTSSATFTASSPVASVSAAQSVVTSSADALSSSPSTSLTASALAPPAITAFSSLNSSSSSVVDAAPGSNSDPLTLSVSHGRLSLAPTVELSFTTGTNGSPSLTVSGAASNLNAALNSATDKPRATHVGSESLSFADPNRGDSLSTATTVVFTAAALSAPAVVAPSSGTPGRDGSLAAATSNGNAISFAGAAASSGSNSLTTSVAPGTIALASATGLSFTTDTNGSASFTVTGSPADPNAALNGLSDRSGTTHADSDSLSFTASNPGDSLTAATTVVFTAAALSAPAIAAPPSRTLDQNDLLVFSVSKGTAISIKGGGVSSGTNSLTLSVAHGTITLASTTGLSFTAGTNGSPAFTVSGSAANLNAALSGMVYTPTRNFAGSDSLAMKVSDSNGGYALTSVALRVNVIAPTLTAPATGTVPLNGMLTFYKRAIKIGNVNASTDIEQVTLRANHGNLKLGSTTGITFLAGANNCSSMVISGTLTNLNAALNDLRFAPSTDYFGSGTISLKYTDAKNGLTVATNINVAIGPIHSSFGPPIQTTSTQTIAVSPALQSTPSTADGTATQLDLSTTQAADDLARWDKFMASMGLQNR
jgi:hypothetical protein